MHQHASVVEEIRALMASTFDLDVVELPYEIDQQTFAHWTSLKHLTLLAALEEEFGVQFSMTEMFEITSLTAIVAALKDRKV